MPESWGREERYPRAEVLLLWVYAVREDDAVAVLVRLALLATLPAVDTRFSVSICSLTASTFLRYAPPPANPAVDRGVPPTDGPPPPSLQGAMLFQKWILLGAALQGEFRPLCMSDLKCTSLCGTPFLSAAEDALEAQVSGRLHASAAAAALNNLACWMPWSARASTSSKFSC